jgi:hypothetical protein
MVPEQTFITAPSVYIAAPVMPAARRSRLGDKPIRHQVFRAAQDRADRARVRATAWHLQGCGRVGLCLQVPSGRLACVPWSGGHAGWQFHLTQRKVRRRCSHIMGIRFQSGEGPRRTGCQPGVEQPVRNCTPSCSTSCVRR